jgi:DNA-directed RNA polymerase subunit RPC12/RpoP
MREWRSQIENLTPADVLFYYDKGLNDAEIAQKLNCTKGNIWYWRKKLKLKANANRGAQYGERNQVFKAIMNGNWRDPSKRVDVRKRLSEVRFGSNNPNWKDGFNRPHIKNFLELNGISTSNCAICGSTKNIHIHHVDGNIFNNQLDNLLVVCAKCHASFHDWGQKPYKRITLYCANCGKRIERCLSNLARKKTKHYFCSPKCWYEYRRNHNIDKPRKAKLIRCSNCDSEILVAPARLKRYKRHFCSKDCFHEYERKNVEVIRDTWGKFLQVNWKK